MTTVIDPEEISAMTPDEAFAVLGDETRLKILETLSVADEPLVFSELFDRIEYDTSANFSYHLEKLEGHFVRKTEEGYELGQVGTRVIQAVLAGTVTDAPQLERTPIDQQCEYCGAQTEISYHQGILGLFCTECSSDITDDWPPEFRGFIRGYSFPPAGLQGRTADEVHRTAFVWGLFQELLVARGICPICSGPLDHEIDACSDHDTEEDFCNECGRRRATLVTGQCTNCIAEGGIRLRTYILTETEVLAFLTRHGINPLAPALGPWQAVETAEDIRSLDPFRARITVAVDDEAITVAVNENLAVTDISLSLTSEP